jgi:hypothetical protein
MIARGTSLGDRDMRRRGMLRVLVAWTLVALVIGIGVAIQAMSSLNDGQQACFFNYPAVPCPGNDDPAIARLTFAFFGVPLVWLLGIGLVALGSALQHRRAASSG